MDTKINMYILSIFLKVQIDILYMRGYMSNLNLHKLFEWVWLWLWTFKFSLSKWYIYFQNLRPPKFCHPSPSLLVHRWRAVFVG